jgi:hypothetical protein
MLETFPNLNLFSDIREYYPQYYKTYHIASAAEVNLIYLNKDKLPGFSGYTRSVWTSTYRNNAEAFYFDFDYGALSYMYAGGPTFDVILVKSLNNETSS